MYQEQLAREVRTYLTGWQFIIEDAGKSFRRIGAAFRRLQKHIADLPFTMPPR